MRKVDSADMAAGTEKTVQAMMGRMGAEVLAWRKRRGVSQAVLAEKVGVSLAYVSRIENANTEPSWAVVVSMAKALGVKPARLLFGPGER